MKKLLLLLPILVLYTSSLFSQCLVKKPIISGDTNVCNYDCKRLKATSSKNDTITWYKVENGDTVNLGTGNQKWDSISGLTYKDKPGKYLYLATSKNGCESDFVTIPVTVKATPKVTLSSTTFGLYDTALTVKASPVGGNFSISEYENGTVIYYSMACIELKGTPSKGSDSTYIFPRSKMREGYYYQLSYSYTDSNGCSSYYRDARIQTPTLSPPTGPTSYEFKYDKPNKIITVQGDSGATYSWFWGIPGTIPEMPVKTGTDNFIDIDSFYGVIKPIPLSPFTIFVRQTINGYTSEPMQIEFTFKECLAPTPTLIQNLYEVPLGEVFPAITVSPNSTKYEVQWYNYPTNSVPLNIGNKYVPVKSGEYYVLYKDIEDNCNGSFTKVTVRDICNPDITPDIDTLIIDTINRYYSGVNLTLRNLLTNSQTVKWYSDSITLNYVGLKYTKKNPSNPQTYYVAIYDSAQKCESRLKKFTYKTVDCAVNFKISSQYFSLYQGDSLPTFSVDAPGQTVYWTQYNSSESSKGYVKVGDGNTFTPTITKPGYYHYKAESDSGKCPFSKSAGTINLNEVYISGYVSTTSTVNTSTNSLFITSQQIHVMPDDVYIPCRQDGYFKFNPNHFGTYTLSIVPNNFTDIVSSQTNLSFVIDKNNHTYRNNVVFVVKPKQNQELSTSVTNLSRAAVGRTFPIQVSVMNYGSTYKQVPVKVSLSKYLQFDSCSNKNAILNDTTLSFNMDSINSLSYNAATIYCKVLPDFLLAGKIIKVKAELGVVTMGDTDPLNNADSVVTPILNSLDPNDIQGSPRFTDKGYVLFNKPLTYIIQFQNTGNIDAENISIIDTLDANFDIRTLQIIDQSHRMIYDTAGNIVRFNFRNIYLPDSTTDATASHGFVKFMIYPKTIADENTAILNKAYIYFDYNPPVITNTELSTYVSVLPELPLLKAQQIVFEPIPMKTVAEKTFTLSAIGGSSGNKVVFSSSDTSIAVCSGSFGEIITIKKPGTCVIYARQSGNGNFADAILSEQILDIKQGIVTVKALENQSKTYGDSDPILQYDYSSSDGENIAFSGQLERESGESFGTYNITQGTLTAGNNYGIIFNPAIFEIKEKESSSSDIVQSEVSVQVFPNPSNSGKGCTIRLNNFEEDELIDAGIEIIDAKGVMVAFINNLKPSNSVILPTGLYLGTVVTKSGNNYCFRVIVSE